jgi:hypothetical protein
LLKVEDGNDLERGRRRLGVKERSERRKKKKTSTNLGLGNNLTKSSMLAADWSIEPLSAIEELGEGGEVRGR